MAKKRSVCVYVNENNVEEEEEQVSMTVPRTVPTVCHCQSTKDNDIKDIKTGTRKGKPRDNANILQSILNLRKTEKREGRFLIIGGERNVAYTICWLKQDKI